MQISALAIQPFVWQIFTEDLPEVESLPRKRILNFLLENFKNLAIPYLVRTKVIYFLKSHTLFLILSKLVTKEIILVIFF